MSVPETPSPMRLAQHEVDRLQSSPTFLEWLHNSDGRPIVVPHKVAGSGWDATWEQVTVDLHRYVYPAPWAIREYRYLCNVAMAGEQEIARSECWRWFRPGEDVIGAPIPPHEDRR